MNRDVCEHFNPVDLPCAKCEEKRTSEALFLADELEIPLGTVIQSEVCRRAAAELRRLHDLAMELQGKIYALEMARSMEQKTAKLKRDALLEAALVEPVQEPVAWQWLDTAHFRKKIPADATPAHWRPLYTAPPQRKPLTEEEIDSIWDSEKAFADIYAIARAIERAHGMTP